MPRLNCWMLAYIINKRHLTSSSLAIRFSSSLTIRNIRIPRAPIRRRR
jgi:hypothetical protein